jgi:hypothetical protein
MGNRNEEASQNPLQTTVDQVEAKVELLRNAGQFVVGHDAKRQAGCTRGISSLICGSEQLANGNQDPPSGASVTRYVERLSYTIVGVSFSRSQNRLLLAAAIKAATVSSWLKSMSPSPAWRLAFFVSCGIPAQPIAFS